MLFIVPELKSANFLHRTEVGNLEILRSKAEPS